VLRVGDTFSGAVAIFCLVPSRRVYWSTISLDLSDYFSSIANLRGCVIVFLIGMRSKGRAIAKVDEYRKSPAGLPLKSSIGAE
jgi:hypothetical protein